jgi:N-acylglucosamine-6-phosphate 2-epimerase
MQTKKNLTYPILDRLKSVLIVSCQASQGEPLASPEHITALALSVINGGAKGLRLEGAENIKAVRAVTNVPIIGLSKSKIIKDSERLEKVYITASFAEAEELAKAGSDIIAIDATERPRPDGLDLRKTIELIHKELNKPVLADISTFEEGVNAQQCGADLVSTTLYGYTKETELPPTQGPGLELLKRLASRLQIPVILEGRIWSPQEVSQGFADGAYAVIVGSAITRPQLITERFVQALPSD